MTSELRTYILNDSMTAKSFEDIQKGIKTFRETRYLSRMSEYNAAVKYYCEKNNVSESILPQFSAMDDANGYNENPNVPSAQTVIDVFKDHVEKNRELMASVIEGRPPCVVLSVDHTFHVQRKTKEQEEQPAPGNIPAHPLLIVTQTHIPKVIVGP
jgi:hypothetical protein